MTAINLNLNKTNINLDQARFNMVNQQIKPWEVLDSQVLDAISSVPREQFVPQRYRNLAFAQIEIPLGHGQAMMSPIIEGRVLQALALRPTDVILEIGTGSGFLTAVLARLAKHVYSVDIHEDFVMDARSRLNELGITNATIESGDGSAGWDRYAPYDVIVITGSLTELPDKFSHSLRPNGRLFAIVGAPPIMEACLITKVNEYGYMREDIFETVVSPLITPSNAQRFVF